MHERLSGQTNEAETAFQAQFVGKKCRVLKF